MKNILIALIMLISTTTYAHADGDFYVIPVIKNVEVCNGTPVGNKSFVLTSRASLAIGDVFKTSAGYLIMITGHTDRYSHWTISYDEGDSFRVAPSTLPKPTFGVKGPYYYLEDNGLIAYAKYL